MKTIGIVRKIDELGRVVIPIELRRSLRWADQEPIEILAQGDQIVLRKHQVSCAACGETEIDQLVACGQIRICRACVDGCRP